MIGARDHFMTNSAPQCDPLLCQSPQRGGHTQSQVLRVSLNVSLNPKQHGCYSGGRFGCSMLILCLFERNLKIFEFSSLPLKNAGAALLCADEGITSPLSLSEAADRKTTNRHDSNVCAIIGSSVGALNK